ncbi:M24 family metallopeptidase [Aerococcus kribbianus]|uniref:Aminopeptidase P family protein n=1 Tax=Aerococcus kribbianus TaxID=2999064 RepID=A0A9X3FRI8_9LACT|nr:MULTISPECIES: aminopeptidase P family protein [unclassified Aerococcus]MCZ0717017.1 aminopeptidase P family protein [Aerococcus sp. YH-aer221]MCZ0725305.1 aminopeptidase P family protein [Aerococcus sp. YH-aer222]
MEKRVRALQANMASEGLGAYYVISPFNLRYISGFTGTSGRALITANNAYFITDFRYQEQAKSQCQGFEVIIAGGSAGSSSPFKVIQDIVSQESVSRIGYEEEHITVADFDEIESLIDADFVPASGMIEILRQEKDDQEIALIEKACQIADDAFSYILNHIKVGVSEIQIANALDFYMREQGASGVSFETIVASGQRSAMPHGVASSKKIAQGDLVTLDFGCYYQGYASDMTRTVAVGDIDSRLEEIYQIVLDANQLVTQELKAGMTGKEADAIARDYISQHGFGNQFGHSLGHSFGLDIHETPNLGPNSNHLLKANQIVSNEPGIYIEGLGGVRIEDDLLLTESGNRPLTHSPRHLIHL